MSEIFSDEEIQDLVNQFNDYPRHKGWIFFNDRKYSEAIEEYKKCLNTDNNDEKKEILACIGDSYLMLQNFSEAINYYNESLKIDPEYLYSIEMLGAVYTFAINDYEKGVDYNIKAEKLNSENGIVYYNIACYHSIKNDKDKAFEYLDKAIKYGYTDIENITSDGDLINIKSDDRFIPLINQIRQNSNRY